MRLEATFRAPSIIVTAEAPAAAIKTGAPVAKVYLERDPYLGPYTVAPGEEPVTLATDALRMTGDVVVAAIPRNYGRITWDGVTLSVY